jgi:hypothetical protein
LEHFLIRPNEGDESLSKINFAARFPGEGLDGSLIPAVNSIDTGWK